MTHPTHSYPPDAWCCTRCGERLTSPLAQAPCPARVVDRVVELARPTPDQEAYLNKIREHVGKYDEDAIVGGPSRVVCADGSRADADTLPCDAEADGQR